jgi:hypothetical protein
MPSLLAAPHSANGINGAHRTTLALIADPDLSSEQTASAPQTTPTINRLGIKITPNFVPTDASQGTPDGTFPITKHHINPIIISVNLDNTIQPPAGPPNQPTLMARLTQPTIDDSTDPLPWIPKMQLSQPAF